MCSLKLKVILLSLFDTELPESLIMLYILGILDPNNKVKIMFVMFLILSMNHRFYIQYLRVFKKITPNCV